jgi:hypothetical protein
MEPNTDSIDSNDSQPVQPIVSPEPDAMQPVSVPSVQPPVEASSQPIEPLPTTPPTPPPAEALPAMVPPLPSSAPATTASVITVGNMDVPSSTPVVSGVEPLAAPVVSANTGLSRFKPLLIGVAALIVLGGGSAAAYYGVVVPNKPANVLKMAITNSLQQTQTSFTGTLQGSSTSAGSPAYKVGINGSGDSVAKAADITFNVTVSGVTFPVEARLVNKNVYVKVGDLTPIVTIMSAADPTLASLGKSLSSQLSNKWIVIDSTLIDQIPGASCVLDTNASLTKTDIQLLQDQYVKHRFVAIQSTGGDTVNGKSAEKFNLSLDDDTASAYLNSLNDLSLIKALNKCEPGVASVKYTSLADHDKTPLTVWVDKGSKQIVRIASQSTAQDAKKGVKGSLTLDLSYGKVSITAPANAEPALQVLSGLESSLGSGSIDPSSLLSGLILGSALGSDTSAGASSTGSLSNNANDAKRQTDIASLQTQLEAYFAQNGNYPSLSEINSSTWRQANMRSLDVTALQDPSGTSKTLVATPAAKVYAYQVTNSSGASCEVASTNCAKYKLTATLSNGSAYTKTNLD